MEQTISFILIDVGPQPVRFENIPPGRQASGRFQIIGDDHYKVRGQLADGSPLNGDVGYVTNTMDGVEAFFVIRPDGKIQFRDTWRGH
jgi:hypothetical protein